MATNNLPFLPAAGDIADGVSPYTAQNSINQNDVLRRHQESFEAWGVGVVPSDPNALKVTAGTGRNFNLSAGLAFVQHSTNGPFFLRQTAVTNEGPLEANRGSGDEIFLFLVAQRESFNDSALSGQGALIAWDNDTYDGGVLLATVTTGASTITSIVLNADRFITFDTDIHGLTSESTPDGTDEIALWDSATGTNKKATVTQLLLAAEAGGDVSGPASSVNDNFAIFDGTTGKLLKDSGKPVPSGNPVGTTATQTLTNKTLTAPTINAATLTGVVTAPTVATDDSSTNIATTALVDNKIAALGDGSAVISVNGASGVVVLDAGDIGLGDVDNTSDADKPISDAAQIELEAKIDSSEKGSDNGVATLGGTGKVPVSQLPAAIGGTSAGTISSADQTKLNGVATGATANDTDANLKARANHTGTQAISTITMNTEKLLGRGAASSGVVEEITLGDGLELDGTTLSVTVEGGSDAETIQGVPVSATTPTTDQILGFDGTEWKPIDAPEGGGGGSTPLAEPWVDGSDEGLDGSVTAFDKKNLVSLQNPVDSAVELFDDAGASLGFVRVSVEPDLFIVGGVGHNDSQTMTAGANKVEWTDSSPGWWNSGDVTRLTVPSGKGGVFQIQAQIYDKGFSSARHHRAMLLVNGIDQFGSNVDIQYLPANTEGLLRISTRMSLEEFDYIEMFIAVGVLDDGEFTADGSYSVDVELGSLDAYELTRQPSTGESGGGTDGGVPTGGATGQILSKASGTDYDMQWSDPPSGGGVGGGSYAVADLPDAEDYRGATVECTDGGFGGSFCLAAALGDPAKWYMIPHSGELGGFNPTTLSGFNFWLKKGDPGIGSAWSGIDAFGDANNGTLKSGAAWVSGKVSFDGSDDCVEDFATPISPVGSRTICIWATNTDSGFGRRGLVGTRGGGGGGFFFGQYTSTQMQYNLLSGTTWRPTVTMPTFSTRCMYAVTHDVVTGIATMYLNGVQVAQNLTFGAGEPAQSFNGRIGGEQEGSSSENFQGTIDQVLIYSEALSSGDIATLYAEMP